MRFIVDIALVLAVLAVAIPAAVLFLECVFALIPRRKPAESEDPAAQRPRVSVLIPAYNEQTIIGGTVSAIQSELADRDGVLVVADNCTDRTAEIARSRGAEVIERFDSENRSKGFALDCGFAHLAKDPPDVVVVLDADCRVTPGSIQRLAECAVSHGRPAQARDELSLRSDASPLARVSALAFLVRNHVRPTGLQRLGLPCNLMGTGMALPWHVVLAAPPAGSHLAEDMQMGLELVSLGFAPIYCEAACITSKAPKGSAVARLQRQRWEHGHISTLLEKGPKLIVGGLLRRRWLEAAVGLDLMVPPLALLALLLTVALVLSLVWSMAGGSRLPLELATAGVGLYAGGVSLAWLKFGQEILPARHLLTVPLYVMWKLPLYLSFIARGAYPHWDRTERSSSAF